MSEKHPHLDWQLIGYPSIRNFKILIGWAATKNHKKASALNEVIRSWIKTLPEREQEEYIKLFDSMTPDQRKNPAKYKDSLLSH